MLFVESTIEKLIKCGFFSLEKFYLRIRVLPLLKEVVQEANNPVLEESKLLAKQYTEHIELLEEHIRLQKIYIDLLKKELKD